MRDEETLMMLGRRVEQRRNDAALDIVLDIVRTEAASTSTSLQRHQVVLKGNSGRTYRLILIDYVRVWNGAPPQTTKW